MSMDDLSFRKSMCVMPRSARQIRRATELVIYIPPGVLAKGNDHEQGHRADDDEHHVLPQLAGLQPLAAQSPVA